jgi:hypothetical protein
LDWKKEQYLCAKSWKRHGSGNAFQGKYKPGDKVLKSSKIDLVLGDGKASYEEDLGTDEYKSNRRITK